MKPELTLTQLNRREPIVHFGCTWTEIKRCIWRGLALALPPTFALMAASPVPVLMVVPGLGLWLGLAYSLTRHIHKFRAGKPLHYERHRKTARRPPFVQPGAVYQFARNGRPGPRSRPRPR